MQIFDGNPVVFIAGPLSILVSLGLFYLVQLPLRIRSQAKANVGALKPQHDPVHANDRRAEFCA